ncbi:MAG: hypothetical protein Q9216_005298 [Gyalolechia sp. 2 TL-2023]
MTIQEALDYGQQRVQFLATDLHVLKMSLLVLNADLHHPFIVHQDQRKSSGAWEMDLGHGVLHKPWMYLPTPQNLLAGLWDPKKTAEDAKGGIENERHGRTANPGHMVHLPSQRSPTGNWTSLIHWTLRASMERVVAPMQAFAKDSINNTLGGSGPVNKDLDLNQFHGRGAEGFTDYSTSRVGTFAAEPEPYAGSSAPIRRGAGVRPGVDRTTSYNPTNRVEPVHGSESLGLGTSTFLEGAPAAKAAIQRRESEPEGSGNVGGLGRKRSLAQKIRGISNANRNFDRPTGRVTSPNGMYERTTSPTSPVEVQSGGGMPKIRETKPFFDDYDEAYERKGQRIQIAEEQNRMEGGGTRARGFSSPKRGPVPPGILERRVTHDGAGASADSEAKKEGFLSRVKSLKGGKRARPERREL